MADASALALSPAKARQLLNERASESLFPFLARVHPVVVPEANFIDARHLRVIAWHAEKVVRGEIKRLAIAVPPRHFKSIVCSVALPTWALGINPGLKIICASYGADLAKLFAGQSRAILQSNVYQRIFPNVHLKSVNPALDRLSTTAGGYRLATSVSGVVTGIGANLLIVDDPMKAIEAHSLIERENVFNWYKGSLMSRFDRPSEGAVIVVMQRLHQDDLIGRLLAEEGWTYLKLPGEAQERMSYPAHGIGRLTLEPGDLLFPDRFGRHDLEQQKLDLGEAGYNAQILQTPSPPDGALIKLGHFRRYDSLPAKSQIERVFQFWDTALVDSPTADYSCCTTWGVSGKRLYLIDVFRRQMSYPDLEKAVIRLQAHFSADMVGVEHAGTGIVLDQSLRCVRGVPWLRHMKPDVGKAERIAQQVPKIERGRVFLPKSAPWLAAFEQEVADYPYGRHDDQVDSMAYFLKLFDHGRVSLLRDLTMWAGWQPGTPVL